MDINNTFTIADGASATPFSCTSGPRVQVDAPNGHLVKASAGTTTLNMMVDNDDTLTVQAGQLVLQGGTGGETSAGAYIANAGATLQLGTCCVDPFLIGSTGRVGGPGTVVVSGLPTLAAGATLDPGTLNLVFSRLTLNGSAALSLPTVNITGGELDTDRPVTVNALSVTSGINRGQLHRHRPRERQLLEDHPGPPERSANSGAQSADLILNVDAELTGGTICAAHDGGAPTDPGTLIVNQDFTIGAGAPQLAFTCSANTIRVNGPSGRLLKSGAGTTTNNGKVEVAGGTVPIGAGQTFEIFNGIAQSCGTDRNRLGRCAAGLGRPSPAGCCVARVR